MIDQSEVVLWLQLQSQIFHCSTELKKKKIKKLTCTSCTWNLITSATKTIVLNNINVFKIKLIYDPWNGNKFEMKKVKITN